MAHQYLSLSEKVIPVKLASIGQSLTTATPPQLYYSSMSSLTGYGRAISTVTHYLGKGDREVSKASSPKPPNHKQHLAKADRDSGGFSRTNSSVNTILVETAPQSTVNILFRSSSSSVNVLQDHKRSKNVLRQMRTFEEPVRMVLNITKPVIQEVHELILPYRNIKQEIHPVKEYVHTVIKDSHNNHPTEHNPEDNVKWTQDMFTDHLKADELTLGKRNTSLEDPSADENMQNLKNFVSYLQSQEQQNFDGKTTNEITNNHPNDSKKEPSLKNEEENWSDRSNEKFDPVYLPLSYQDFTEPLTNQHSTRQTKQSFSNEQHNHRNPTDLTGQNVSQPADTARLYSNLTSIVHH